MFIYLSLNIWKFYLTQSLRCGLLNTMVMNSNIFERLYLHLCIYFLVSCYTPYIQEPSVKTLRSHFPPNLRGIVECQTRVGTWTRKWKYFMIPWMWIKPTNVASKATRHAANLLNLKFILFTSNSYIFTFRSLTLQIHILPFISWT